MDDIENYGHGPGSSEAGGIAEAGSGDANPGKVYDNYIVLTPQPKVIRDRIVEQAATDSLIGYSKCQIIGSCDARFPESLGRPCVSNPDSAADQTKHGFCNYDAEGDWLCMRTALWWSYGAQYATDAAASEDAKFKHDIRENVGYQGCPKNFKNCTSAHGQPTACTPGTPATTDLSGAWQPRLLIGGCMISTDSWYTGWEEVHLPDACASNQNLPAAEVGCMDKGAYNFNAAARQPGRCKYRTLGCKNILALNYNSEATDDDGTCILGTCGCSIGATAGSAYDGVHPSTDKYKSLFVAKPLPDASNLAESGKVVYAPYSAVTEDYVMSPARYASGTTTTRGNAGTATVLGGSTCGGIGLGSAELCTFAIEGCMDQNAINYNSQATMNTNTWCVQPVTGCMMPTVERSSGGRGTRTSLKNNRFGYAIASGAGFYDTAATVHGTCTVHNKGCMDSTAVNYHAWATVPDTCYKKKIGCAHKNATNYGCTDYISDTGTGVGGQVIKPCPDGQENGPAPITEHQNAFCNFYAIEATATATAETAQVTLVVDVDCTIFSTEATPCSSPSGLRRLARHPRSQEAVAVSAYRVCSRTSTRRRSGSSR
jgi:hypothetical protein